MTKRSKIDVGWGGGETSLFLHVDENGTPVVFDYMYDHFALHNICGGRLVYQSRSGCRGEGYLDNLGDLIDLGWYRVDTARNHYQFFSRIGTIWDEESQNPLEVKVAVPYFKWEKDKSDTLKGYPTVIKIGTKVIYCDFYVNFVKILKLIFTGEELPKSYEHDGFYRRHAYRRIEKTFTEVASFYYERSVVLEHYNLCSIYNTPNPWEFLQDELEEFRVEDTERLYELLCIEKKGGRFWRTISVDKIRYRQEILPGNPLETGELTAGWEWEEDNIIVRRYGDDIHLLAFSPAESAYDKRIRRLANSLDEGDEFISFIKSHIPERDYVIYEEVVPKGNYLFGGNKILASLKKRLAEDIYNEVDYFASLWKEIKSAPSL